MAKPNAYNVPSAPGT